MDVGAGKRFGWFAPCRRPTKAEDVSFGLSDTRSLTFPRPQFLESFLDANERLRLAVRMKGLYRAIMGNPSGFYTLDLSSTQGRMAAIKVRGHDSHRQS